MALTSGSTITNALDQYNNNLVWEGDATKAQACLEAVRWLLVNRAQGVTESGATLNYESLQQEKERLEAFVETVVARSTTAPFVGARANLW